MNKTKRNVALITGGGRGIGEAVCYKMAEAGCSVAIGYNSNKQQAAAVKERIISRGGLAEIFKISVENFYNCLKVIDNIGDCLGNVNILVNNAGVTQDKSFKKMSIEQWRKVLHVNLEGTFYCSKACLNSLLQSKWGRIVNISSIIGQTGNAGQSNYAAAKAGLIGLTKSLAMELVGKGVTVNAVAPGFIATDMTNSVPSGIMAQIQEKIPMKRLGQPKEVADLVGFLSSDEASYITGQVFGVNGGLYM